MHMIDIQGVNKWYGAFQVLRDCTTRVDKAEVVVICGPSGSGKSTLIKCINALEPFQKGQIHVDGVPVNTLGTSTVNWDLVKSQGTRSGVDLVWHRTPGFGDSNWTDIITLLRQGGFTGAIDIEGWHDPIYREDLEMTGQVRGLEYLKACRGGAFVPNPN